MKAGGGDARLAKSNPRHRKYEHFYRAGLFQRGGACRSRRTGREHIVNQQYGLAANSFGMANGKSVGNTIAARACVHSRAMKRGVNAPPDAMFIKRQVTNPRERMSQHRRLIETAFAFALGMKRNGNNQSCLIDRFALLRREHQLTHPARDMGLTLE